MADIKKKKKNKKVSISEEDISLILQRYSAMQIIDLLREVQQCPDVKINWTEMVKNTSTKIANAREMQMLWRHLAYRSGMEDHAEIGAEPLDDDSDLESELEAIPPVSNEASTEAAACVKVLLTSGSQSNSGPSNRSTIEAPLTINVPSGQVLSDNLQSTYAQGININVPVYVLKVPMPAMPSTKVPEGNGAAGSDVLPAQKKKKPRLWTAEEDMELIAAVQKCGERNWANILKGDFKGDRNATQLSQRWSILKKRQANLNSGETAIKTNPQLSEQQLANRAVSHALKMPVSAAGSVGATQSGIPSSSVAAADKASQVSNTAVGNSVTQSLQQIGVSIQKGSSNMTAKARVTIKKGPLASAPGPNPMLQATAVAAGARIATPLTATSLLNATPSKNTIHIRPVGSSVIKTSMPGGTKPFPSNPTGARSHVHYIRTGFTQPGISQQEHTNSMRPPVLAGLVPLPITDTSNLAVQQNISAPPPVPGKKVHAISAANAEGEKSAEQLKEKIFRNACNGDDPYSEALNDIQKPAVENLTDTQNMEVDENDQSTTLDDKMNIENITDGFHGK